MQYNDDINDTIDTKNTIDTIDTAPIKYNEKDTPARTIYKLFLEWNQSTNSPCEFIWSRHHWSKLHVLDIFKHIGQDTFPFSGSKSHFLVLNSKILCFKSS